MQYETRPMTPEEADRIERRIDAYNESVVPPVDGAEEEEIVLKITDGDGAIIAGCSAFVDRQNCMDLSMLWVDEAYRNRGLGSRLFSEILRAGTARGCRIATVGLYDFQASAFCEKRGMTVFDAAEDCPKGHAHYYLAIRLDPDAQEDAPADPRYAIKRGDANDGEFLLERFYAHSEAQVPPLRPYEALDRTVLNEAGDPIAGVEAGVNGWNVGYVFSLWVDEAYRNRGIGAELLRGAERGIKARGVDRAFVSAFDWQADYFKKNGYAVTGVCEDFPRGHSLLMLKKKL